MDRVPVAQGLTRGAELAPVASASAAKFSVAGLFQIFFLHAEACRTNVANLSVTLYEYTVKHRCHSNAFLIAFQRLIEKPRSCECQR